VGNIIHPRCWPVARPCRSISLRCRFRYSRRIIEGRGAGKGAPRNWPRPNCSKPTRLPFLSIIRKCFHAGRQIRSRTLRFHFLSVIDVWLKKIRITDVRTNAGSFPAQRTKDYFLRLINDRAEMFSAFQAFRVQFIDVLRSGRPGSKPTAHRDDLQASDRRIITRRPR
jgi:hypothetical protein